MGLYILDKFLGRDRKKLVLELTYGCNSACQKCCVNSRLGKSPYMDLDTARIAIDYAIPYGIDYLLLTGGEPTLVPYLQDIVEYGHAKGVKTRVNTNGRKNAFNYWERLKNVGLDFVVVSIDSSHNNPELNKRAVPLRTAFKTINTLIRLGIETAVPITPSIDSVEYDTALYEFLSACYGTLGDIIKEKYYTRLSVDGKDHHITLHAPFNYNGRTREIHPPKQMPCPSKVDLEQRFFIRLNPYNEIRMPCGSEQQLEIRPDIFDPKDPESLIRGIKSIQADPQFLQFLKTGTETGDDVCNFCIREYLNKREAAV